MNVQDLHELLELEKKFYQKLNEALGLTSELAEAVTRQDPVSIRALIAMRQKPLLELQEISSYIDLKRVDLNKTDAAQFDGLLSGKHPQLPEEIPVADQIAANRRLVDRLTQLDRQISQTLCGEDSFYKK